MGKVRSSIAVGVVLAGGVLAGCASDVPLSNLGHMTERWIAAAPESITPTTAPAVPAPVGLLATTGVETVEWVNDDLGDLSVTSPDEVVVAVWSRSNREDRHVQASRSEIVAALPGLEFPDLIPENITYITSQLVFDPTIGRLASDSVAAFGYWADQPYTKSRSVSQLAVLMVAIDETSIEPIVPDTIGAPENPPGETRCDVLAGSTVEECSKVTLEDGCSAWSLDVFNGWRLVWSEHGYTYDLFVRNAGNADLLARMAGSSQELAPVVSVLAGPGVPQGSPAESETEEPAEGAGS